MKGILQLICAIIDRLRNILLQDATFLRGHVRFAALLLRANPKY
jgi:hypothetical protein